MENNVFTTLENSNVTLREMVVLGNNIKNVRNSLGLTLLDVARMAKITSTEVGIVEKGQTYTFDPISDTSKIKSSVLKIIEVLKLERCQQTDNA